jgi:DNA-binding response OmpR family regulator
MLNRDDPSQRSPTGDSPLPENTGVRVSPLDPERQGVVSLSEKHGVPGVDVRVMPLDLTDLDLVPRELARRHTVLPLLTRADAMFLAMADPSNRQAQTEIEFVTGRRVFAFAADADALRDLIDRAYEHRARGDAELAPERPSVTPPTQGTRPTAQSVLRNPTPVSTPRRTRHGTLLDAVPPPPRAPGDARRPSPPVVAPVATPSLTLRRAVAPSPARRALVVDADGASRDALADALESLGFAVSEASSAREAFAVATAQPPALMVIDPSLPDEHGLDLVRRMRESAELALVVVVVASTEFNGWRAARDLEALYGVRAVVQKPLAHAQFALRVSDALTPAGTALEEVLPAEADDAMRRSTEAWQRGDLPSAVSHLERAVSAAPDSYRLRYHLGLTLGRKGDVFRAIREVERSVAINDRFFPSLKNLAVLYERAGFRHKALEAWERACLTVTDDATREQIKERVLALLS